MTTDEAAHNTAQILSESLPYMLKYRDQTVVIKYGGNAMQDAAIKRSILSDILLLKTIGIKVVLVHGGGPAITDLLGHYAVKSQFIDGLRYTDETTAKLALEALSGRVNKELVQDIIKLGGSAVGLSGIDGRMIEVEQLDETHGFVGKIKHINTDLINQLLKTNSIPVIATSGIDADGQIYNVNADTAASRIAGALSAEQFILLSDVRGLYSNFPDESSFLPQVTLSALTELIETGKISGGMIPKLEAIKFAMSEGLAQAVLLDGRLQNALLLELFTDQGYGTLICK